MYSESPYILFPARLSVMVHCGRYGASNADAVSAWELMGSTIYNGGGGGFGSDISNYPKLTGPPPPTPPTPDPPKGYAR
jgi:hypothetical protein